MTEQEYLRTAVITGAHALKGWVKIFVVTDIPERFTPGSTVYLFNGASYSPVEVEDFTLQHGKPSLLKLKGYNSRTDVEALKKVELYIHRDQAQRDELDDDSFYYYELIGKTVHVEGKPFGVVSDILDQGGASLFVVKEKESGNSYMVPFVEAMVSLDRLNEDIIDVTPVEGLFDL